MMRNLKFIFLIIILFFLSFCAPVTKSQKTSYFNWDINLQNIRKIAILPFENYTRNEGLASTIREMVLAEVLSQNIFEVVDLSITDLVVFEEGLEKSLRMDKGTIRRIGDRLGVQALLLGSLTHLEEIREGSYSYPVIGISLRLIDVKSGVIIWECKGVKNGYSLPARLFGLKSKSTVELAFELVKDMLKDWKL